VTIPFRILDLFCCAGGAAKGYQRAGFYVVGVDIKPQPHYCGDEFHQADALEYIAEHGHEFDAIHASPPCQRYSEQTRKIFRHNHPDLIAPVRAALKELGKPYVIENVENARGLLDAPTLLCGTMFGMNMWRHRYFETPFTLPLTPPCNHGDFPEPILITGTTRRKPENGGRFEYSAEQCRLESGLSWMTRGEMDEAILPAYTEFIGKQLIAYLET
jgi:DNA (cytosine-5)-methyltransferase 1